MADYQVVLGATCGRISGVDIFSVGLARGLRDLGIPAHVLLTDSSDPVPDALPLPETYRVRDLERAHWRLLA